MRQRFYCIFTDHDDSSKLLKKACQTKGVKFIQLNPEDYDFTQSIKFAKEDMLYRVQVSGKAKDLEKFLIDRQVTTFYKNYERAISSRSNILAYIKEGIPTPKTIYRLTRNKELLSKYAKQLGFPLIIKAMGGSHGVGIIKVDSPSSLFSIADYLLANDRKANLIMKKFIDVKNSARLLVLGDKVIDSIQYRAPKGDFRSNEGATPNVAKKKFPKIIEEIGIKAVQAIGVEFAGVDILIDKKGKGYVAEVNFPCFFPRAQKLTGTDISRMMVEYLIDKSGNK
jgi:RimK family alpha-L-glutamate ligase